MLARIIWKRKDEGGRVKPPTGTGASPYSTIVKFLDSAEPWPTENAWSLVIEKVESQSQEYEWVADIRYLVDEAPNEELRPYRKFELYEGNKCVASGELLETA